MHRQLHKAYPLAILHLWFCNCFIEDKGDTDLLAMDIENHKSRRRFRKWFQRKHQKYDPYQLSQVSGSSIFRSHTSPTSKSFSLHRFQSGLSYDYCMFLQMGVKMKVVITWMILSCGQWRWVHALLLMSWGKLLIFFQNEIVKPTRNRYWFHTSLINIFLYSRIFVGTWNVAGRSPVGSLAVDLEDWLNLKDAADLYVLGYVINRN